MSNINKERVANLLQFNSEGSDCQSNAEQWEVHKLARIALASLEAEAVCVIDQANLDYLNSGSDADVWPASRTEMGDVLLYRAAPPAPVSVPDERYQHLSEIYHAQEKRLFKIAQRIKGPAFDKYAYSPSQAIDVLESEIFGEREDDCRSAMLQGAEPVTKAYKFPGGWVACSERMPDNRGKSHELYLCWGTYFDGAEPDYIPALFFIHPTNGWCEWEPLEDDCDPKKVVITHWMALPAAPQQQEGEA